MKQTVLGYSARKFMNIYTVPFIDLSPPAFVPASSAVGSPFVSDDWEKA